MFQDEIRSLKKSQLLTPKTPEVIVFFKSFIFFGENLAFSIISGGTLDSMLISYWRSIHNTDRLVRRNFIQSSIRIILVCSTVAAVSQHPGVPDMSRSNLESIYDMVLCSVPNLNAQLSITMTLDNVEFRQAISRDGREWTEPAL